MALAQDRVVHAKPPGGPTQVLDYLARYTHRVAISNERIFSSAHGQIQIRVRDRRAGHRRAVTLPVGEVVGRFRR